MSDWRYWITYEGIVAAESESEAVEFALVDVGYSTATPTDVQVEEVGEGE